MKNFTREPNRPIIVLTTDLFRKCLKGKVIRRKDYASNGDVVTKYIDENKDVSLLELELQIYFF